MTFMSDKRDKSREEWQREIVARQQNVTPADYPEGLHYARIEGIPPITSQSRFWLGIVLVAVGIYALSGHLVLGTSGALLGAVLLFTAMRSTA